MTHHVHAEWGRLDEANLYRFYDMFEIADRLDRGS
jgi:hypothetical protein